VPAPEIYLITGGQMLLDDRTGNEALRRVGWDGLSRARPVIRLDSERCTVRRLVHVLALGIAALNPTYGLKAPRRSYWSTASR